MLGKLYESTDQGNYNQQNELITHHFSLGSEYWSIYIYRRWSEPVDYLMNTYWEKSAQNRNSNILCRLEEKPKPKIVS